MSIATALVAQRVCITGNIGIKGEMPRVWSINQRGAKCYVRNRWVS